MYPSIDDVLLEIKRRYMEASKEAAARAAEGDSPAALAASSQCVVLGELAIWIRTPMAGEP